MIKLKKVKVSAKEQARRNGILLWTVFVIVINFLQMICKNWLTTIVAMVGTIYALYRIVVYDNPRNRLSQKYYNWQGKKLKK
ncbi:hypothetical protein [Lactobacillus sp. B4026]|uniref:hypothetical protein n=1 Tax=Lactobacillus sp. B4026 TaxID=2818035 RepID=UPI00226B617F|nr:hypothetical protein [Lactobacillus sp. B4026]